MLGLEKLGSGQGPWEPNADKQKHFLPPDSGVQCFAVWSSFVPDGPTVVETTSLGLGYPRPFPGVFLPKSLAIPVMDADIPASSIIYMVLARAFLFFFTRF